MENRLHNPLKPGAHETTRVPKKMVTHKKNRQSEDLKHVETIQSFSGSPLRLLQNKPGPQPKVESVFSVYFPQLRNGQPWLTATAQCRVLVCCKASSVHFVLCRGKKLRCCPPLLQPGQLRKKSSRGFAKSLVDLIFIHFPARHIGRTEGNNRWRNEIRKLSLVLMLSNSPDSWRATNIGGYGTH